MSTSEICPEISITTVMSTTRMMSQNNPTVDTRQPRSSAASCPVRKISEPESRNSPKGQSLLFTLSKINLEPNSDKAILIHTHINPQLNNTTRNT